MSTSTTHTRGAGTTDANSPTSTQKAGLVLCGLYCAANVTSMFTPAPEGAGDAPPFGILVLATLCGLVGLVATVMAWRGSGVGYRIAAGAIVIATLTGVPAFFVDVPMWVKAMVAASVLITIAAVVLMFSSRRHAPVLD